MTATSSSAQDNSRRQSRVARRRRRVFTLADFRRVAGLRAQAQSIVDRARAVASMLKGTAAGDCAAQLELLVDYSLDPALTDLTAIEEECALRVAGVSE